MGTILRGVLFFTGGVLIAVSFAPLAETNIRWVRVLDFPRLQFLIALLVVGVLIFVFGGPRRRWGWLLMAGMVDLALCQPGRSA